MKHLSNAITKIQACYRGYLYRRNNLPLIMYKLKKFLLSYAIHFSTANEDGRINSSIDGDYITEILVERFGIIIQKPKIRMWYDILAYDYMYGWLPINIKTTTMKSSDNTANLAMCVHCYTDELSLAIEGKRYDNGSMSKILISKLKQKKYNKHHKKDYYFLVLNKTNPRDIVVNSVKGLTLLTPNINNLPFQICWNKNRYFKYKSIDISISQFINCLLKPNPSWQESFMENIRSL